MANESATIVQRVWNYCNVLRDDGVSYGDYVEQLTYLLFLKMDDEKRQRRPAHRHPRRPTTGTACSTTEGDELEIHYRHILAKLGNGLGLIRIIFRKAQNKIQTRPSSSASSR